MLIVPSRGGAYERRVAVAERGRAQAIALVWALNAFV
jgi:hypothetical protein